MEYVIESKPIPSRASRKARLTYPIDKLTPGSNDSFLIAADPEKVKNAMASVRTFAHRNEFSVVLRKEDGGVRVWRTATE